jgi:hypothetical protein
LHKIAHPAAIAVIYQVIAIGEVGLHVHGDAPLRVSCLVTGERGGSSRNGQLTEPRAAQTAISHS